MQIDLVRVVGALLTSSHPDIVDVDLIVKCLGKVASHEVVHHAILVLLVAHRLVPCQTTASSWVRSIGNRRISDVVDLPVGHVQQLVLVSGLPA